MSIGRHLREVIGRRRGTAASPRFPHSEITWRRCRPEAWTATHGGDFVGMVEERYGCFVANDTVRGTYNTYRTRMEAMQAFELPYLAVRDRRGA